MKSMWNNAKKRGERKKREKKNYLNGSKTREDIEEREREDWLIDWLIDFNGMSTCLGLFYT